MTEPYGDTRRSVLRRPATPPGHCIVGHHHRHHLGTLSARPLVDRPPLCVRAGRAATSCKPSTTSAGWTGSLRSRFRSLSPTLCAYGKDIGTNELKFILSTMLTLYDLYWPHGTFCAHWLWGAQDRGDGRELHTSLCMECSPDSYDTGEPSIAIRDPRGRPREPFACLGGYGRLRRETPGRVKG